MAADAARGTPGLTAEDLAAMLPSGPSPRTLQSNITRVADKLREKADLDELKR